MRGPAGYGAARGVVAGPRGVAAGFTRVTPAGRYSTSAAVRRNFNDWGIYGRGWHTAHPGAWYAAGWAAGSAWAAATWAGIGDWFEYPVNVEPVSYDYGTNVTYENNNIYIDGQDAGSAPEYYQQAVTLAEEGTQAQASADEQWLPLGVFALARSGHDQSNVTIQLAVNKKGVIRGNYTDMFSDQPVQVHGSVDKETQRVAFTVGDNKTAVFETGLYNLTKDDAPVSMSIRQGPHRAMAAGASQTAGTG